MRKVDIFDLISKRLRWKTVVIITFISLAVLSLYSSSWFREKLALYYLRVNDYDKVIKLYSKILRKETLDPLHKRASGTERIGGLYFNLINLFFVKNKFSELDELIRQLAKINPAYRTKTLLIPFQSSWDYERFGLFLSREGLIGSATVQFKKYSELKPDDIVGHYRLALIYLKQGMEHNAMKEFSEAAELFSRTTMPPGETPPIFLGNVYYNLALDMEKREDLNGAVKYYEKAIALDDNKMEAYDRLKSIYGKQQDTENYNRISSHLMNVTPAYELNYKFGSNKVLLGYSFDDIESEMSDKFKVTFFWKIENGDRFYEVKMVDNLAPNPCFETDPPFRGFPWRWKHDIYSDSTPETNHEVLIDRKNALLSTQCLMLNNSFSIKRTSCQSDPVGIDDKFYYLQGGRIKGRGAAAYLGGTWTDIKGRGLPHNFVITRTSPSKWEFYSRIILPPPKAKYYYIWVLNFDSECRAYFDDMLFIRLDILKGPK